MDQDSMNPFPRLTKLALTVFTAPAMSADCKQVFSETKRVITDDRNQLSAAAIETILCQKNWLDNKLMKSELLAAANNS